MYAARRIWFWAHLKDRTGRKQKIFAAAHMRGGFVIIPCASKTITRKRQNHAFAFFTQFGNPLPYGKGEIDAHICGVPFKSASMRGKPLGFPLKIARFCFVSSKQNLRASFFTCPSSLS
ncbi:MAG: hypothetical protein ACLSTV_12175, partial [Coriobacteriales bacterium]